MLWLPSEPLALNVVEMEFGEAVARNRVDNCAPTNIQSTCTMVLYKCLFGMLLSLLLQHSTH